MRVRHGAELLARSARIEDRTGVARLERAAERPQPSLHLDRDFVRLSRAEGSLRAKIARGDERAVSVARET